MEEYVIEQNAVIADFLESREAVTKSGDIEISNPHDFFSDLSAAMNKMSSEFTYSSDSLRTKLYVTVWENSEYSVPFDRVKSLIAGRAKRGDIIVGLPNHDYPYCLVNLNNKKYKVGHAEIFTKNVTNSTKVDDWATIGAWTEDGVSRQQLYNWCWKSYLVGVCSYKVKWKWRGFKSRFYVVQTPVSNPAKLADWAEKYEGCSYVHWYEFPTAKWAAPARFTCTTLVWWCAKKAYGERISPWYSTLVTPSDVLCDNNTYLKVEIE